VGDIHTAVAVADGHALHHHAALEGVEFVVANVGTGPAFDLSVRWRGDLIEAVSA
jgi:hypothetical protein